MRSSTHSSRRRSVFHSDVAAFIGLILSIVIGLWFVDVVVQAVAAEPVPEEQVVDTTVVSSDDVFPFSIQMVNSLARYYEAMNDTTVNPDDKIDLFASLVYRRNIIEKVNERLAWYTSSEDADVRYAAGTILESGRALEDSYSHIIDAVKSENKDTIALSAIEEMYNINDHLFNITVTSADTLAAFMGEEEGVDARLTEEQREYLHGYILDTFSQDDMATSTSPSRIYLLEALGATSN